MSRPTDSGSSYPGFDPGRTLDIPPDGEGKDSDQLLADDHFTLDAHDRYVVRSEIGRGGIGVVHEAWDKLLGRTVAIKRLLNRHLGSTEAIRRFHDEARIAGRLQHPGIIPIHEVRQLADGRPYFVMGLVRGETLDKIIAARTSVSADMPRLLNVFLAICETVAYAHEQSVIHRDLKPSNVIVGPFGTVAVTDWGTAKVLGADNRPIVEGDIRATPRFGGRCDTPESASDEWDPHLTRSGTVLGTPAYLSPEQARGEVDHIDKRSDVFGLGSILCEIITGRPPYAGAYGSVVFRKAAAADKTEMIARLETCPAPVDLIALTKWCVAERPDDRPRDAAEVVEVIQSYLHFDERRAEKDLIRFFDLSLDMFCIASYDGLFLRVNENFSRVMGYSVDELTSRPFIEFVHPDDKARTAAECASIASGAKCVRFLNRYRHADGGYLKFEWNAQASHEDRVIYAVARDLTERYDRNGDRSFG